MRAIKNEDGTFTINVSDREMSRVISALQHHFDLFYNMSQHDVDSKTMDFYTDEMGKTSVMYSNLCDVAYTRKEV